MITTQTNVYDSSTIVSSSYIYETMELYVGFKHGTYLYKEVEESDYNAFRDATSQGIALNNIIKGVYKYEKIEEEHAK
jgi:hypothetical protein